MTKAVVSHSKADCEGARPLIIKDELAKYRVGDLDNLLSTCIKQEEQII